ncbi:hypothetical protein BJV77DRAFT_101606 [Russula vinacea]|nr:hypothetical protein BJV77DRAFT_101606 [Russula vinacea]
MTILELTLCYHLFVCFFQGCSTLITVMSCCDFSPPWVFASLTFDRNDDFYTRKLFLCVSFRCSQSAEVDKIPFFTKQIALVRPMT